MFGSSAFSGGSAAQNPNKDTAVTQPPNDSISKVSFSPTANYLIASSWDNNVSLISLSGRVASEVTAGSLLGGAGEWTERGQGGAEPRRTRSRLLLACGQFLFLLFPFSLSNNILE